ncbi:MAG: peptidoglycan DD-metalloendopeptidase family protein [Coriobacteriales bacterium]
MLDYQTAYSYQGRICTHRGIDIAAAAGSTVCAPCNGSIVFCGDVPAAQVDGGGDDGTTMTAVSIELEDGRRLTLMPFAAVAVSPGELVSEGQSLGSLAAGGDRSSQKTHLHMGLKRQGVYCNPLLLFDAVPAGGAVAQQSESSSAGASGASPLPSTPLEAPVQELQPVQAQPAQSAPVFGTVSSGQLEYRPEGQEEAPLPIAALSAAAGPVAAACSAQMQGLVQGLQELSAVSGIPFFALVFASTALVVGVLAATALHIMHLREERASSLNGKSIENAPLCVRVGGDNMHKLFPAPGTSFITRGRSAQRR